MASRTVVDPLGVEWFVLEVPADDAEAAAQSGSAGWLVARSERERRRISPLPAAWTTLSDGELLALIKQACAEAARPLGRRTA